MKKYRFAFAILLIIAAGILAVMYLSGHSIPVLEPKGLISMKERKLIITASFLMLIVVIPVFVFAIYFTWKYREGNGGRHEPDWEHNNIAEFCWWGVPFLIIIVLAIITWKSSHELDPFKPLDEKKKPITIQVVALEWKWLFIYPEQKIASVNFVQFPEKTPVNFQITAEAPMNSFWIPQLAGQIYAMPGMRTKLHLMANETGDFRGTSSNFSGKGFAGMEFMARASTEEEFDLWVQKVSGMGQPLNWSSFQALVVPSEYNPVSYYRLSQPALFDQIIDQYTGPQKEGYGK